MIRNRYLFSSITKKIYRKFSRINYKLSSVTPYGSLFEATCAQDVTQFYFCSKSTFFT